MNEAERRVLNTMVQPPQNRLASCVVCIATHANESCPNYQKLCKDSRVESGHANLCSVQLALEACI